MNNPIYEGVILKLAEYNIDRKFVPTFYKLVLEKNESLKKAAQLIQKGEL